MEHIDTQLTRSVEREAERLCEVVNELERLERLSGRPVPASAIANVMGWSVVELAEEVLKDAVAMGCAIAEPDGGYRLG
jgi:hypothetical protein